MSGIKLYYFNFRGRAEPIRLCLAAAGKEYEDIRLTGEEWQTQKSKAPFGQMPYIVYNGKAYGESRAITCFVARECGLTGKTKEEQLSVDQVFCLGRSFVQAMVKVYYEKDEQRKAEMTTELVEQTTPKFLGYLEKLLTDSGTGHFVGNELTLADLSVQDVTFGLLKRNPNVLDNFPEIQKMIKNVEGHEKVKAYLDSRPDTEM